MRLVIIGGSDAGISAALRARELDPSTDVHMIVADAYPNFSICGLPFFLSGEIPDWRTLAHRTREQIEQTGIHLHLDETATRIDTVAKQVLTAKADGTVKAHPYDRVVIGTGAVPVKPPIEGIDLPNVFLLHSMDESFAVHKRLGEKPKAAVIIGAGYIGLEMADALRHRGMKVTLIERLPHVMRTVDAPIAARVHALLEAKGVTVKVGTDVKSVRQKQSLFGKTGTLQVQCDNGFTADGDLVLVVVGVRPLSDLAATCGVATNDRGAILVDRGMHTNISDVYAAGDCGVTWHRLLQRELYMPLGTTSHKQGRVAGENAVGGNAEFAGTLGTQSVKLFDQVVAGTGLREADATSFSYDPFAVDFTTYDHKVYYPGATEMVVRIIGDKGTGALLGGQIWGAYGKEVSKRIDTIATAIHHRMTVNALSELDLSYTPPLSSPWDPVQMAAQAWVNQIKALK